MADIFLTLISLRVKKNQLVTISGNIFAGLTGNPRFRAVSQTLYISIIFFFILFATVLLRSIGKTKKSSI